MNDGGGQAERNGRNPEDVVTNYLSIIRKLPSLWPSIPSSRRQGYLRTIRLIWPSIPPHQSAILSLATAKIISHVITTDEAENRSQPITSKTKGYTEQLLETLLGLLTDSFFVSYDDLISYSSLPATPEAPLPIHDFQFISLEQTHSYLPENETSFPKTLLPSIVLHPLHHLVSEAYAKASPRPYHLVAAHLLHFLANIAVNESAPTLRRAALHALAAFIRVLHGSLVASFLPGIVSSLTRLLIGSHALPANIVIAALDVLLALIYTAFPQSSNESTTPSSFSSALRDIQKESDASNNVRETDIDDEINITSSNVGNPNDRESKTFRIKRGSQWITQASAELSLRLTILLTNHEGPRSHQNVRVQSALALFTASLLAKETVFALADVTAVQLRTILVSLCGSSHPDVKAIATQQMVALVERKHVKLVDIERGVKALVSYVNDGDNIVQLKNWRTKTKEGLEKSVSSSDKESSEKNIDRDTIQKLAESGKDDFWIRLGVGYLVVLTPRDGSSQGTDEIDHGSALGVNKWIGFSSRVGINSLVQLFAAIQDALWNLSDDSEATLLKAMDNPVLHMAFHIGQVGLLSVMYPTLLSMTSPVNDFDHPEAFASYDKETTAQHLRTFKQRAHAAIILQESFRGAMARKCSTKSEMSQHGSFVHQASKELFMITTTFFLPPIEADVSPLLSSEDEALVNIKCCLLYCVSRLLDEFSDFYRKLNSRPIGGDIVLVLLPSLLLDVSSGDDTVKEFAERALLKLARVTGCSSIRRLLGRHLNFTVSRIIHNLEKEWAGNVLRYTIGNESDETSRETTALLEDTLGNMCNNLAGSSDVEAKKTLLSIRSVLSTASLYKPGISDDETKDISHSDNLDHEQKEKTQNLDESEYLYLKARSEFRKLLLDFCIDDVPNYDKLTEPPPPIKKSIDYWNDDATENENPFETLALNTLDGMRDLLVGRPWNVRAIALECATLAVKLLEGRYKALLPHAATLLPLLPDQFSVLHEELNAGERVFRAFKRKKAQGKEDGEDVEDLVSFLNTKASELPVVTNACLLLSAFAEHVGSFMQDRFVQLIFPKLRPLLRLAAQYPSLMVIRAADGTGELLPTPSYGAMSASDACLEALSSIAEYVPEVLSTYTLTLLKYLMVFIDSRMYYGTTGQRRIEHTNRTMVKYENERMERRIKLADCIVRNLRTVNPGDVLVGLLRNSTQKELIPVDQSFHTIQVCDYSKTHNPKAMK